MREYTIQDIHTFGSLNTSATALFQLDDWNYLYENQLWQKEFAFYTEHTLKEHLYHCYRNKTNSLICKDKAKNEHEYLLSYRRITIDGGYALLMSAIPLIGPYQNTVMADGRRDQNRIRNEITPCGIFGIRMSSAQEIHLTYANEYCYAMLGYAKGTVQNELIFSASVIYNEDYQMFLERIQTAIQGQEEQFEVAYRAYHRDGACHWLLARFVPDVLPDHLLGCVFDISDQRRTLEQLRINEEIKRIALRQGNLMILLYDAASHTLYLTEEGIVVNDPDKVIFNVPEESEQRNRVSADTLPDFIEFFEHIQQGISNGQVVFKHTDAEYQEYRWVKAQYTLLYNKQNQPQTAIISCEDHTEIHEKELAYHVWKQNFDVKKEKSIVYYEYDLTNDVFEHLEGITSSALPDGERSSFSSVADFAAHHFVFATDRRSYLSFFSRPYLLAQYQKGNANLYLLHRRFHSDGTVFWAKGEIQMVLDPYTGFVKASVLIYDVDEEVCKELHLKRSSERDFLTGVYNREAFIQKVEEVCKQKDCQKMLILLDLDHFKELNDTLGHQYGDEVLKEMARRMRIFCQDGEVCARIGGDEFMLLLHQSDSMKKTKDRLEELKDLLQDEFEHQLITASIGAAQFPKDGTTFEMLYTKADRAMYQAKKNGRNQIAF